MELAVNCVFFFFFFMEKRRREKDAWKGLKVHEMGGAVVNVKACNQNVEGTPTL